MDEAVEKALEGNLALQAHWRKALVSIEQNLRLNERLSTRLQRTLALIRTPGAGLSVGQGVVYPRRLPPFFIDKRRETPQSNPDVLSFGGSAGHSKPDLLFGSAAWRVGDLKKLRGAIERQLKINRFVFLFNIRKMIFILSCLGTDKGLRMALICFVRFFTPLRSTGKRLRWRCA